MPFCFCCMSSEEKVHLVMSNFGALQRLDQIEQSNFPQFIGGRILPLKHHVLTAPISGKPCVYYEAYVEELQEKTDDNGMIGIVDPEEPRKVWMPLYREVKAANFAIVDPQFPGVLLHVPGAVVPINVLANEDTMTRSRLRSKMIVRDVNKQQSTKEFLARANINLDGHHRTIRFREANFEQGEQIAVLGVAYETEAKHKFLKAVDHKVLTADFFARKALAEWDRLAWLDLTEQPCLIVTDMEKYFQGMALQELPKNIELPEAVEGTVEVSTSTVEAQGMAR